MYSNTGFDASNFVATFNTSFYFIVIISLILLIGLTVTMIYFIARYNRKKNKVATPIEGNNVLEILWTVIPTLLALVMFYFGWAGWKPLAKAPDNSLEVTSVARMWSFSFIYENGKESRELVVPVNRPVNVKLTSLDVIHSLFIPAFRIKSDMIPGRDKSMWFLPKSEGDYDLYCAEYCGLQHSFMTSNVKVLPEDEFMAWYADTSMVVPVAEAEGPGAEGFAIMRSNGCNVCHSSDGSRIVGPSYLNLYGEQQTVIRDRKEFTVTVDDEYIRRAIFDPNAEIVKGYPTGLMQSYTGTISEEDLSKIIEYLRSLSKN